MQEDTSRWLVLKNNNNNNKKKNFKTNLKVPEGFERSILKGQVKEGFTGYVIISCSILWLVGGEVTG